MTAATQSNVSDLQAARCKAALERIAQADADHERIASKTREDWHEYGAGLLAQRELMPDKRAFGKWVTDNGLDTGSAASPVTRSNAIWMAQHWAELDASKSKNHHPNHLRQECRKAGYPWAFVKPKKGDAPRAKPKPKVKPEGDYGLSMTAKQKLDRAIAKEIKRLSADFWPQVHEQVAKLVVAERDNYERGSAAARETVAKYTKLREGLPGLITQEDYRFVIGCLHSDKHPPEEREKWDKAFRIIRSLGDLAKWPKGKR